MASEDFAELAIPVASARDAPTVSGTERGGPQKPEVTEYMLGLNLRPEFRGKRLKGTAIELSNETNTGATQIAAAEFLEITYPTHDLLKGIEAVGPSQGRPVVVIGERG